MVPRHAAHMTIGLEARQDLAGLGVDLQEVFATVVADPEAAQQPSSSPRRRRRERSSPSTWPLSGSIFDPVAADLPEVLAVERRSRVGGDTRQAPEDCSVFGMDAHHPGHRPVDAPNGLAVPGDTVHLADRQRKRARNVDTFDRLAQAHRARLSARRALINSRC